MRYGRTHDILTSYTMPHLKKKIIRKVNHEIDNPSPAYKQFKKNLGLQDDMFHLPFIKYYPHRRKGGHDWTDAIYLTSKYGQAGFEAWLGHQFWEMVSDSTVKNYGSFFRNIGEDAILEFSRPKYRKKG